MKQDVLIIGAGASGFAAAITAARRGLSCSILEAEEKPLKKLLRTGNGRCNFTHSEISPAAYRSRDPQIVAKVLDSFPTERAVSFLESTGVVPWE